MNTTIRKYYEYSMKEHQNLHHHRVSFNEYHKVRNRLNTTQKIKLKSNEFP